MSIARIFSQDIEKEICDKYKLGIKLVHLMKEYKCANKALKNVLRKYNVPFTQRKSPIKATPELDAKIVELYSNCFNMSEVARICGCSDEHIASTLRRLKIEIKSDKKNILSLEQEIIRLYVEENMSATQIANKHNIFRKTVSSLLKRNNIQKHQTCSWIRKYPLYDNYFDNINTENKAYFLGLLFADGCNLSTVESTKSVVINLQERDKDILIKFSKELFDGNEFLYFLDAPTVNHQNQYRLTISSKQISNRLTELGCVSNKSLILEYPNYMINNDLQKHFLRGFFDGDGCLTFNLNKEKATCSFIWQITSSNLFCEKVKEILTNILLDINFHTKQTNKHLPDRSEITTTLFSGGNNQVLKIMNYLYKDATIYIERKYHRYTELLAWTEYMKNKHINPNLEPPFPTLYKDYKSNNEQDDKTSNILTEIN